ncbi:MAG: sigma-70 region 4 domain-containing protein [Actinomycetota bacterium]|nr:sigma-70 region 4 domain-containing protein [Actinomycetota bacterium]
MAGVEQLPPDQRAVLQLLLKQGRSYDDLSSVLRMDAESVRDRAHLALETLGPDTDLSDDRLDEVADYLLGQQPASARAQTREFLAGSASGRAWARVVAGELRPLAPDGGLPEIPAEDEEVDEAFDALEARRERRQDVEHSSKLGGILLLAGLGVALAVVIVLLISGGGDDNGGEGNAGETPPAQQEEQVVGQINLLPPDGGESPLGAAQLLAADRGLSIRIAAEQLEPATEERVYALWLYNSEDDAELIGYPTVQPTAEEPLLLAQDMLPPTVGQFESLVVTAEGRTEETASSPGEIVLRGPIPQEQGQGGAGGAQPPAQQPGD